MSLTFATPDADRVRCNQCMKVVTAAVASDVCPACGFEGGLMDIRGDEPLRFWPLAWPNENNRLTTVSEALGFPSSALVDEDNGCILYGAHPHVAAVAVILEFVQDEAASGEEALQLLAVARSALAELHC